VIREGDSFERVLGLINSAAPGLFRSGPEAEVWKGVRSLTHSGLEYRWQGLAP